MTSQRLKVRDTRELLNPVTPPTQPSQVTQPTVPSTASARPNPVSSTAQKTPVPPPMTVTHTSQGRGGQGSSRRDSGPVSKKQRILESAAAEVREGEKQGQIQVERQAQHKDAVDVERSQKVGAYDILAQVCSAVGIDSDLAESVVEETPSTHSQLEGVPNHLQYIRGSRPPPPGILLPNPRMRYHPVRPIHRVPYDNPLMIEETRVPYHQYPPRPHEPYLVSRLPLRSELPEHHSLAQYPRVQYIRHPRPGPQSTSTSHLLPAQSPGGARHPLPNTSPTLPQHYQPALRHTASRPLLHQQTTLPMQDQRHAAPNNLRHLAPHNLRHPAPHNLRHPAPHDLRHPAPHELRHPVPHDLRHPTPQDLRHPAPHELRHPATHDLHRLAPHDLRHPAPQDPAPPLQHDQRHPSPKDIRHHVSPEQGHTAFQDLRQPSPREIRHPAPRSLRHPSSHESRHLVAHELYHPGRHPLPQDARHSTPQGLHQPPPHDLNHPAQHDLRHPSPRSLRYPLPSDPRNPSRELRFPSPLDLRHPSQYDTQHPLPHNFHHSSPMELRQPGPTDLRHPSPHALRQSPVPPHPHRQLSADLPHPSSPALPHPNTHEKPAPRDLRHTYPPSLCDSKVTSNQGGRSAAPLPHVMRHGPPPGSGTHIATPHLSPDMAQASVVRSELQSGRPLETQGLPEPQHYSLERLTSTRVNPRPNQDPPHYRPIQPKIAGVLQHQGTELDTIKRDALVPTASPHNLSQRSADAWVAQRTLEGSSDITETVHPRRMMEPPPPCVELIPLGPLSSSFENVTPHTFSVNHTSTASPQMVQQHNQPLSSSYVSSPHTLNNDRGSAEGRSWDQTNLGIQEKSKEEEETPPATDFVLDKKVFSAARQVKSLIRGFSLLRPASEPPQGASAAEAAATSRPSSLPCANQSDPSFPSTKLVTFEDEPDNPFMYYLKLALDDLVSVPEAAALQKLSSPVQLLACMVKCLQRFGAQPSKNPDPVQRLRENFLSVVRTCLSKDQLQTFGWTTCAPEQILTQLFQKGENGAGELNGSVASCHLSFTHDDPLEDDVFTPPPAVTPTCDGNVSAAPTSQSTLHSCTPITLSSPHPTAVTRQPSPYHPHGRSPVTHPSVNHRDLQTHPGLHPSTPTPNTTPPLSTPKTHASSQPSSTVPASPPDRNPSQAVPPSTLPTHTIPSSTCASPTVTASKLSTHTVPSATHPSHQIGPLHLSQHIPAPNQPFLTSHHSSHPYPTVAYPNRPLYTTHQQSTATHTTSLRGGSYCVPAPCPSRHPYHRMPEHHNLTYPYPHPQVLHVSYSNNLRSSHLSPQISPPTYTTVSSSHPHNLIIQNSSQSPTSIMSHPNLPSTSNPSHSNTQSSHTSESLQDAPLSHLTTTSHPVSSTGQSSSLRSRPTPIKPKPSSSQSYPARSHYPDPVTDSSSSLPPQEPHPKSPLSLSATRAAKRISQRRSPLPRRKAARGDSKRETSGRVLRGEKRAERSKRTGAEGRASRTPVNGYTTP